MKIKRFKNLWLMGLILSAIILGAIYILKIFMPQFVIEIAQIDSIVRIGHYIDTHKWAWYLASFVLSFVSCYLTCCASCKKKRLNTKENIILVATIIILYAVKDFLPAQYNVLNMSSMIFLPLLFKGDFKATTVVFVFTNLLQSFTLEIRNISSMIIDFNYATLIILTIDFYILSFLLYFYFNFKEENV